MRWILLALSLRLEPSMIIFLVAVLFFFYFSSFSCFFFYPKSQIGEKGDNVEAAGPVIEKKKIT